MKQAQKAPKRTPRQRVLISTVTLKIAYLNTLAHFLKTSGQFLNQIHLDVEIDGKIGVLVSRIYSSADVEIDIRRFLKQEPAYHRSAVLFEVPVLVKPVISQIILCILDNLVHCYNALCYQIYAIDKSNGRNVTALEFQACLNRLAEVFRSDRGGGATANDMFSFF